MVNKVKSHLLPWFCGGGCDPALCECSEVSSSNYCHDGTTDTSYSMSTSALRPLDHSINWLAHLGPVLSENQLIVLIV